MGKEIEKKFLLKNENWRKLAKGKKYCQGYLSTEKGRTVRVRIIGEKGFLTIKGPSKGETRLEFEYEIPLSEANELLEKLCHKPLIQKTRYKVPFAGFIWEIDEFEGKNKGLILAEIELQHVGETFAVPEWIDREVTDDPRYYNANLVTNPFCNW
ncbi:CYTH domain-containing protein [Desulfomarina sp.]